MHRVVNVELVGLVYGWLQLVGKRHGVSRHECVVSSAVVADSTTSSEVGVWWSDGNDICVRFRVRVLLRRVIDVEHVGFVYGWLQLVGKRH